MKECEQNPYGGLVNWWSQSMGEIEIGKNTSSRSLFKSTSYQSVTGRSQE